ncbi:ATP-dependent DNA ligase [Metallosphaera tengchongensis]|uniref:DNA ligase n=1 Tax=Metallosphaera tengchongensis TaxID=1532350 RepID=A0A6N0NUY9_9CREN|nr:ATP-dependent DNA ligase [Metallosphaera tengchongensis]QKQ99994.1 ATP-dependent DNA ligase [Metallosphaera tengchongensis]
MKFKLIAEYFDKLEKITSRIQLTSLLSELFSKTDRDLLDKVVYLIQGRLWPDFTGLPEIGMGEKYLIKAIAMATGIKEDEVERTYKSIGDLGEVALSLKTKHNEVNILSFIKAPEKTNELEVKEVYDDLAKIATSMGGGSRDIKIRIFVGLLKKASPLEAKYLVRFVEGRLRLGIGDATVLDALAITFGGSADYRPIVERAYNLRADLGNIARVIANDGIEKLKNITPIPGIPIRPMLAERLADPKEIMDKVKGKALVDYKYDGERAQIHRSGDDIKIFSRRMENITAQYLDVVAYVKDYVKSKDLIIEGEIVPIDPESGEMRPFQELMHRRRKNEIHEAIKEYPVNLFLFDLMYLDGKDFTNEPILNRRRALEEILETNDKVHIASHIIVDNVTDLMNYFYQAISDGSEGVMVKSISEESVYQAGSRGWLWIKLKRDYQSEMADTVDLVVVGAFYGKGKRGGKYSSLLMAAYNPEKDVFETVCKVASGFSDQELEDMQTKLESLKRADKHPRVVSQMVPDVWITPSLVAEIIGAEITISPLHTCCKNDRGGLSIRFPRFLRWRDDKSPDDATTNLEIQEMYSKQLKKVEEKSIDENI